MSKFIKNNFKTIMFILFLGLIIGGIFLYRYIRNNTGEYVPNDGPVEYEIKRYEDNQYTVINIDDIDVYNSYYKEFLRLMVNNPTVAYAKLSEDCKKIAFNDNYKEFLKYTKNIDNTVIATGKVNRYRKDKNKIYIIDNFDMGYVFTENGVWNYTVYISGRVE